MNLDKINELIPVFKLIIIISVALYCAGYVAGRVLYHLDKSGFFESIFK